MSWVRRWLGEPVPRPWSAREGAGLLAEVRRLEIRARKAMHEGLAGRYRSAFRGRGLEFEEVREYRWGDDVRTVDHNVTARTGRLHVKLHREERDLTVLLVVDLSASTRAGSGAMTVHDAIAEVASLFALAAARRDRVGAVLFDGRVRTLIPPRGGWRHGLRVVREVLAAAPAGRGTAFGEALEAADRLLRRRGVVIAVVDRACPAPARELRAVAARHDLVAVRVADPVAVRGAPAPLPAADPESGRAGWVERAVPAAPPAWPARADVVDLVAGEDELPAVARVLERRERRRAR